MPVPSPEVSGSGIIIIGDFPPAVFHPEWFVEKELFAAEEADAARIEIVSSEATAFTITWLSFLADRNRLQFITSSEPIVRIQDLALGLIAHFAEAPVRFVGLNRDVHLKLGSEAAWHRLGDRLAPKDCWPDEFVIREPLQDRTATIRWAGLRSLTMERPRVEPTGYTHMRIEPSQIVRPFGVYFGSNDHYTLNEDSRPAAARQAADLIRERWEGAMATADRIRNTILERAQ